MFEVVAVIRGWHLVGLIFTLSAIWGIAAWLIECNCHECRKRRARR